MSTIDKALPNVVENSVTTPSDEEVALAEEKVLESQGGEGVDIQENEDGSVDVNFEPNKINQEGTDSHFDNLADLLPEDILGRLGSELFTNYMNYKSSRKEWEDSYVKGLDLLGFKYEDRTQPFEGASGVTHPVLGEAVTQFQAQAYKELLPAKGPVHTQIMGVDQQTKRRPSYQSKKFHELSAHE